MLDNLFYRPFNDRFGGGSVKVDSHFQGRFVAGIDFVDAIGLFRPLLFATINVEFPTTDFADLADFNQQALARGQPLLRLNALQGVADRAVCLVPVELAFDEHVLCPIPHGADAQVLVLDAGQHNHRDIRCRSPDLMQCRQPHAVGQTKVQQNQIDVFALQPRERLG